MQPDPEILKAIVTTKMPYGKYKDKLICDLPVHYLEWQAGQGFPKGKMGMMLATVYEMKINGLGELIAELKQRFGKI